MNSRRATILTLLAASACSPIMTLPPPVDAGVTTDAGLEPTDAGPDDAGTDAGGPMVDAGTWRVAWTQSLDFPTVVDHHTTFIAPRNGAPTLFVVGGQITETSDLFDSLFAATIFPDGGLGPWQLAGTLPLPRAFHAMAANTPNGTFLAGGIVRTAAGVGGESEVSSLVFRPDGGIEFALHSSIRQVSLHSTLDAVRGQLVLVGGSGSAGPQTSVWSVTHTAPGYEAVDGGLRSLARRVAELPVARSHHASVVYRDSIYLVGGFTTGEMPVTAIHRSRHDDAGVVAGWDEVGTISEAPWTHSAFVLDDAIFVVGGGFQASPPWLGRVRRAPFLPDGRVGAFVDVRAPLPVPRAHVHQTPVHDGFLYSVGGRVAMPPPTMFGSTERVDIGRVVHE